MTDKIKNILGIVLIAALAVGAVSAVRYVNAYSKNQNASRTFVVKGEGKRTAIPDVARFSAGVTTEGKKGLGELQKENTEKMNAILEYLKDEGVEAKDIKTTRYEVSPKYSNPSCSYDYSATPAEYVCPPSEITGYAIMQKAEVTVRNFEKIGDIVGGVVEHGANNVSSLTFTVERPEALENEARAEAIQKAKEKARNMAKAGGFRLGSIQSIYMDNYDQTPGLYEYGYDRMSSASPVVQPGTQEIAVSVSITYGIQ